MALLPCLSLQLREGDEARQNAPIINSNRMHEEEEKIAPPPQMSSGIRPRPVILKAAAATHGKQNGASLCFGPPLETPMPFIQDLHPLCIARIHRAQQHPETMTAVGYLL